MIPRKKKMMKNQNFNPPNVNNINININNNQILNNMPNFGNIDFQHMIEFIKKNPEILKMGGKDIDQKSCRNLWKE